MYSSDGLRETDEYGPLHQVTLTSTLAAGTGGTDLAAGTEVPALAAHRERRCHVDWLGGMIFWLVVVEGDRPWRARRRRIGVLLPVEAIPPRVIHPFPLSFREVEELLLQRGVIVSYETIRRWCAKFGQAYANGLRRRRPRPGDKLHLDEASSSATGSTSTCGGPSTRTATCSTSSCRTGGTRPPPGASSAA